MGSWLDLFSNHLGRQSRSRFIATSVLVSLGFSVLLFAPKFWIMGRVTPGSFEWARGLTFIQQCEDPLSGSDIEPAMRWRLLPPVLAHVLGLGGSVAFLVPWAGLIAFLWYWTAAAERLLGDRGEALLTTLLVGTTAGVITITNWLGINDGWFLLGLMAVACGRGWQSLVVAGLLAPWVDERFIIGWPAAYFCRSWLQAAPPLAPRRLLLAALPLVPYFTARMAVALAGIDETSSRFLVDALQKVSGYIAHAHLGWWMGYRTGWLLLAVLAWTWWRERGWQLSIIGIFTHVGALATILLLASDVSRSTNVIMPALLCGAVALHRIGWSSPMRRFALAATVAANLLLPLVLVVYTKIIVVWPLPLELIRLLRAGAQGS